MSQTRQASLRALAKINLDLRVLRARPDGYHEIRTIFQTISLADIIHIEFTRASGTTIQIDGDVDIPDNLMAKAATLVLDAMRVTAWVRFRLRKRIPMGAGLGGGSSDAAAVLLALPAWLAAVWPCLASWNLPPNWAATYLFSCWAARPSPWAAEPNYIHCPIRRRLPGF
jgi:4-diphosphocytidyl-2C-methyl-D-erythritol kinase